MPKVCNLDPQEGVGLKIYLGLSQNWGYRIGVPNQDYSILGYTLGSTYFGKLAFLLPLYDPFESPHEAIKNQNLIGPPNQASPRALSLDALKLLRSPKERCHCLGFGIRLRSYRLGLCRGFGFRVFDCIACGISFWDFDLMLLGLGFRV